MEKLLKNIRTVVVKGFSDVLVESPVDTGRFRSNWMTSVGAPSTETVEGTQKVRRAPASTAEVKEIEDEAKKLGDGVTSIHFTNNLDYAQQLEAGHSSQNEGFVARAVRNIDRRLEAIYKS